MPVLHHPLDIQVLADYHCTGIRNGTGKLMVEVFPLAGDLPVLPCHGSPGFFIVLRPGMGLLVVLLPGKGFLKASQAPFMQPDPSRVCHRDKAFHVPCHAEFLQPQVQAEYIALLYHHNRLDPVDHGLQAEGRFKPARAAFGYDCIQDPCPWREDGTNRLPEREDGPDQPDLWELQVRQAVFPNDQVQVVVCILCHIAVPVGLPFGSEAGKIRPPGEEILICVINMLQGSFQGELV